MNPEPLLRPGDLFIPNMKTDDFTHTRHAIDFTEPSIDGNWHNIPRHQQEKRSKIIGIGVVADLAASR
jgi:hypothetical protein